MVRAHFVRFPKTAVGYTYIHTDTQPECFIPCCECIRGGNQLLHVLELCHQDALDKREADHFKFLEVVDYFAATLCQRLQVDNNVEPLIGTRETRAHIVFYA